LLNIFLKKNYKNFIEEYFNNFLKKEMKSKESIKREFVLEAKMI